jgi:hypothetical protein
MSVFARPGTRTGGKTITERDRLMNTNRLCIAAVTAFLAASFVVAQDVLPKPEEAFKDAKIGRTYKDSTPGEAHHHQTW